MLSNKESEWVKTETRPAYVISEEERQDGSRQLRQEDEEDEHEELEQRTNSSLHFCLRQQSFQKSNCIVIKVITRPPLEGGVPQFDTTMNQTWGFFNQNFYRLNSDKYIHD